MTILITGAPGSESSVLHAALRELPGKPAGLFFMEDAASAEAAIFCVHGSMGLIEDPLDEFTQGLPLVGMYIIWPDDTGDREMLEMEIRESLEGRGIRRDIPIHIGKPALALQGDADEQNGLRSFLRDCNIV